MSRIEKQPGSMRDDYDRRIAADQAKIGELDGAVVGLLVLEERSDYPLLDNVAVSPAMQGRSFGRELIGFAEREASRHGLTEHRFYAHALMVENIALYGRLGFKEIGRIQEQEVDRVYMGRPLF